MSTLCDFGKDISFFFLSTVFYARNKRNPRVSVLNDQKNSHSGKLWLLEICGPIREWVQKPVFHSGMRPITSTKIPNEKMFQIRQIVVIGAIREWMLLVF